MRLVFVGADHTGRFQLIDHVPVAAIQYPAGHPHTAETPQLRSLRRRHRRVFCPGDPWQFRCGLAGHAEIIPHPRQL